MNTSSSADGISEDGVIVGTSVHNGETHAGAMMPVTPSPTPTPMPTLTPIATPTSTPTPVPRVTPTPRGHPTPRSRPYQVVEMSRQACRLHGALATGTAATRSKERHCRISRKN